MLWLNKADLSSEHQHGPPGSPFLGARGMTRDACAHPGLLVSNEDLGTRSQPSDRGLLRLRRPPGGGDQEGPRQTKGRRPIVSWGSLRKNLKTLMGHPPLQA